MDFIKKNIGWFLLGILGITIWLGHTEPSDDYPVFLFYLMIPVVLWKTPPFSWSDRVFGYAASKDPLGTKRATKNFMDKRGNKWYWWLGYTILLWGFPSIVVSLISGEPTLVLIG